MGTVSNYSDSSQRLLNWTIRLKEVFLVFYRLEDAVIVTDDTRKVNRDNCFGLFGYSRFHGIVVHFKTVFLTVNKLDSCTHMNRGTGRSGISISGD